MRTASLRNGIAAGAAAVLVVTTVGVVVGSPAGTDRPSRGMIAQLPGRF